MSVFNRIPYLCSYGEPYNRVKGSTIGHGALNDEHAFTAVAGLRVGGGDNAVTSVGRNRRLEPVGLDELLD